MLFFRFLESTILEQVKRGDTVAFRRLYREYEKPIYRFIYFRTNNEETAEDLTSEVFIKTLDFLKKSEDLEIKNFRAFIYQIARNLIIDFYRSRKELSSFDESIESRLPVDSNLPKITDQKIALDELRGHLNLLEPEYREPFLLHYFSGLSYKEIALVLEDKEANVKMRAHRAKKTLQGKMKNS